MGKLQALSQFGTSAVLLLTLTSACGYSFRNSRTPLVETYQVKRIYVAPVVNDTFQAGVDSLLYNAVTQTLEAQGALQLVDDPELADGVLYAGATSLKVTPGSISGGDALPSDVLSRGITRHAESKEHALGGFGFTTEYTADLAASFALIKSDTGSTRTPIWTATLSRGKSYSAGLQTGVLGTTSHLIADSNLSRAIDELIELMMIDLRESMLLMF